MINPILSAYLHIASLLLLLDATLDISIEIGAAGSFESVISAVLALERAAKLNLNPEPNELLVLPPL